MATKAKVDHNKITQFLINMLVLGDMFVVDKNNQIHYRNSPEEPILISSREGYPAQPLYVYSMNTEDPNALIWNPFVETTAAGTERLWCYNALSVVLAKWIMHIQHDFISRCVEQKNNSGTIEPSLVPILSKFIDRVDNKTLEEFEHIEKNSNIKEYFNIYFNRLKKKSVVFAGFEEESMDFYKSFPKGKIRKKSWELFLEMLKLILNVDNNSTIKDTYTYSTDKVEHPQFETFTNVWIKAWKAIAPYLIYFETVEDTNELIAHIEDELPMAKVYRECTMWLSQSTAVKSNTDAKRMTVPKTVSSVVSNNTVTTTNNNNNATDAANTVVTKAPESNTSSWKSMNTGYTNPANVVVTRVNSAMNYNNYNNYNTYNQNNNVATSGDKSWKTMGNSNNNNMFYNGYRY